MQVEGITISYCKLFRANRLPTPAHASVTPNFPFGCTVAMKLLGIMLRNRWWPTTFLTITTGDADGWCRNCSVRLVPQRHLMYVSFYMSLCLCSNKKQQSAELVFRENVSISGQDPNVSKSNRSHVDIFRFFFINPGCIPYIPLKWSVRFYEVINFN